jgi:hypothetical protein
MMNEVLQKPEPNSASFNRRQWCVRTAVLAASSTALIPKRTAAVSRVEPKLVAGVVTAYAKNLHADVLLGKILEGWKQDGGPGPALKLASMYVDQFPDQDMARAMSKKYGVPIFDSIEGALTLGGDRIPIDGVISIGEHGDYPWNEKQQHLYPRRRFFEAITNAFAKYKRVVPVFNDKHLGPTWEDAKWMYDRSVEMKVPFMAGSSMTVGYRAPEIQVPFGKEMEAAVGIGYSGLDIYGSHALEFYQCHVERRANAETGVKWVECLSGERMWRELDEGRISRELFEKALSVIDHDSGDAKKDREAALFRFQYADGFQGNVIMLPSYARGTSIAVQLKGSTQPMAERFDERTEPRYPHFAFLLKAIERMIHTGRPTYPVERTLLTSGILDRALTSLAQNQQRLMTPELQIAYLPVDYPHGPNPNLEMDPI